MTTYSWKTAADGDWATAGSWTPAGPPNASTADAVIGLAGSYTATVGYSSAYTLDSLKLSGAGATLEVDGTLNLTGAKTMTVSAGVLLLDSYGTIKGATVANTGGTIQFNGGTLDGVTYRGTLDLSAGGAVYVNNGITLTGSSGTGAGAIVLGSIDNGVYGQILVTSSTTLNNATITMSYGYLYNDDVSGAGQILTLGSGLTVVDAGYAYFYGYGYAGDGIVNQGKIVAGYNGGSGFYINGNSFTNQGSIAVSNGDRMTISSTSFSNTGTVTANAASLILYVGWTNTGKITVTNGGTLQLGNDLTTAWGSVGSISATASTVNLYGQFTTAKLKTLVLSNDTITVTGNLVNTGTTLAVGGASALGTLGLTGTVTGGVIADAGSGFAFNGGTLDGVTYRGTMNVNGAAFINNGITLTGASGTGAGAVVLGSTDGSTSGAVYVTSSTTLNNATITLGYGQLYNYDQSGTGQVLTLGSGLTLADGFYAVVGNYFGNTGDTIVNQGKIVASYSGGYGFSIGGSSFTNQGSIAVSNGDRMTITATTFSNTGTVTANAASLILYAGWTNTGKIAVTNGGTLQLGNDSTTAWGSVASISATASTVNLYGQFTTAKLKTLVLSNDAITIAGNLVNTGTTLAVGGASTLGTLGLSGTITRGVIADAGAGFTFNGGTLDGVTYRGTLGVNGQVFVNNGITLTGASGTGAGAVVLGSSDGSSSGSMLVTSSTTLNNATITLAYGNLYNYDPSETGQVLTLGSGLTLVDGNYANLSGYYGSSSIGIVNQGKIVAGYSGGSGFYIGGNNSFTNQGSIAVSNGDRMTISAATFSNTGTVTANAASLILYPGWTNTGKIAVTNGGTLQLGNDSTTAWGSIGSISAHRLDGQSVWPVTTAKLKTLVLSNDTVTIAGNLVNTGTTLTIGGASALGTLGLSGTITGGVIADASSGFAFNGGTLDGATYRGTLNVSGSVYVSDGITLTGSSGTGAGTVVLGSADGSSSGYLYVVGSTTLNNATITIASGYLFNYDSSATGQILTLGSGLTLIDGGQAYLYDYGYAGDGIVNQGDIVASANTGYGFNIVGNSFTNQGTIAVSNGDTLGINSTTFTNLSGTTLSGGTYSVTGASILSVQNTSTIATLNANLTLSGVGSIVQSYNTATSTYVALESTLTTIGTSGALRLLGARGYSTTKTITDKGQIVLNGGTFSSGGTLTIASTGTLMGYGIVKPIVANAGLLYAQGGTLAITGSVSGSGALRADAGAVLQLKQAALTSIAGKVTLNGAGSVIQFGTASPFTTLESSVTAIAATGTLAVLGGRGFTSSNTLTDSGVFNIAGGTFSIASLVTASGGRVVGNGTIANTIANSGTIESNGGLLKLAAGASGSGTLLVDAGSTLELAATTTAGTVTDSGVLKLDGQTLTATTTTIAAGGKILGKGTLANVVANAGTIESNGGLLKLSAGASGTGALIVDAGSTLELAATTSAGTVTDSGILKLDGQTLTATTTTVATGGKILGKGTLANAVANAGTIESNGGLLKLSGTVTGSGKLIVDAGSTLELAGTTSAGTITDSGVLKLDGKTATATATTLAATGLIQGYGTLTGTVADGGTIDAKGGLLKLSGVVSGSGALQIENASTLELGAAASQAVTFASGAVGTLQLDAQASFTGAIKGLALGDGIKFSSETVSSAVVSGTTLTVVGSAGTVAYQVAGSLSGNHFAIQSDQHTIKLVAGAGAAARPQFLASRASAAPVAGFGSLVAADWTAPPVVATEGAYVPEPLAAGGIAMLLHAPRADILFAHQ